jgi:hypothetical protein
MSDTFTKNKLLWLDQVVADHSLSETAAVIP